MRSSGLAVLAALATLSCGRPDPPNAYVDPKLCASCHAGIWETYRKTGMARSFYRPGPQTSVEDYTVRNTLKHFTMIEREGRYFQRSEREGVIEKEVHYVMGSGNHVRTYLTRTPRNTLAELPVAWYAEKGGYWGMNPGYDRPDHPGFRRNVSYDCMFCHNAYPKIDQAGADPVFPAAMPEGIDCQRCHGPGGRHVANPSDARASIVNPARLSAERQLEVCLQCHLETTSFPLPNSIVRFGRGPFSYRPGEPLADFMLFFDHAEDKGRGGKFEIVGSAYRLMRSACFVKSAGKLRCTTCHNPHDIPRGAKAAEAYAAACRQCHASGQHTVSGDCAACHMPKRRTEDVVHAVMTDHLIARKPPEGLLRELAERRETGASAYRGEVVPYYPRPLPATPEDELYLAAVQVSQMSNLEAGTRQLAAAVAKHRPERPEFYLQLAEAYRNGGEIAKALPLYEEAVRRGPASVAVLRKAGAGARKAEYLERALAAASDDAEAWHELGLIRLAEGNRAGALAAFAKALECDPEMPELHNSLGGVYFESGDRARAEAEFRLAVLHRPGYAEAHSNLGNALSAAGEFERARVHFEEAIRRRPDYSAARYNYGVALASTRRFDEAERQMRAALKADPNLAEAHQLLGTLLARRGDVAGALPHLRNAARGGSPALREEAVRLLRELGADQ
jgi:tetratricopeptide (TPR) repeat protein